jgi:hypothetical protein
MTETHNENELTANSAIINELGATPATADDPNLFAELALSQDFGSAIAVKKVLNQVPIRKPDKQQFIQVHPDTTWRMETAIFEAKTDREIYLVGKSVRTEVAGMFPGFIRPVVLVACITSNNDPFLWPIALPSSDGRTNPWHRSARDAAEHAAKGKWIHVIPDMEAGYYRVSEAVGNLPAPEWPVKSFEELLKIAVRDRIIKDIDHFVIRKLRGLS